MGEPLTQLSEAVQSFLSVNGQLPIAFYKQFWSSFRGSPENTSYFLTILFSKLVGLTTGEDKHTSLSDIVAKIVADESNISVADLSKLPPDVDVNNANLRQFLWLTLYFIGLHIPFNESSSSFKSAYAKWLEFHAAQRGSVQWKDFTDEVIRVMAPSYIESNDMISLVVERASTIDVPLDLAQDITEARALSRCLLAQWLSIMMTREKLSNTVLESVLLFLRHPLLPEDRMLCLVHLLVKLIMYAPYIQPKAIALGLSLVKNYYLWPRPYGTFARTALEALTLEARSPGASLRNSILQEFPVLMKHAFSTGKERAVYIIADMKIMEGRVIHEMLKYHPAEDLTIHQVQVDLLANMLQRVLGISAQHLGLEYCVIEYVAELFQEALDIMDQAMKLPEKDAHLVRTTRFSEMRERILANMRFTPQCSKPRVPTPLARVFSLTSVTCETVKPRKGDDFVDANFRFPVRSQCTNALSGFLAPYKMIKAKLKSAASARATIHTKLPIRVKIGIIGNDVSIHHVVGAYVCLRRNQPLLFKDMALQFYLLPVGSVTQNQFAGFLSRYDRWFYRHQWLGVKAYCSILPSVSVTAVTPTNPPPESSADSKRIGDMSASRSRVRVDPQDRVSLAHLVDSIKEVQKQKQVMNDFLRPTGDDADGHGSETTDNNNNNNNNNENSHETSSSENSNSVNNAYTDNTNNTDDGHSANITTNNVHSKITNINSGDNNHTNEMNGNRRGVPVGKPNEKAMGNRSRSSVRSNTLPITTGLGTKAAPVDRTALPLSPSRLLRQEIEAYFREAKNPLNVKIFQCECFSVFGDEVYNYTIPFVTKVELGLNASLRAFQEANDLPMTLSAADIIANKLFKYFPINLTTKYVQTNPLGVARPVQSTDMRSYTTITMTNLGNTADRVHPNPVVPWFELCVVESDSKKKKGREEAVNVCMVEADTEDKKKLFDVLIDGEVYGPVYRIRISACSGSADNDAEQLEFPVMTYLPIDL